MTLRAPYQWMLLAVITLGVYYPALFGGYSPVDDITRITHLINLNSFDFYHLFFRSGGYYYRPLVAATFYFDQIFWGAEAFPMHAVNLFIHLLNASVLLIVIRTFFARDAAIPDWLTIVLVLLFALHPVNTEAVCWISGRYDLLATTFVLLSVGQLLRALDESSLWRMLPALLFALIGCLAKETALFFFGGAILIIYVQERQRRYHLPELIRAVFPGALLWTVGAVGYMIFRNWALSSRDTGVSTLVKSAGALDGTFAWADQLRIAVKVSGFYLKKIFFPYPLNFAIIEISHVYLLFGIVLLLLCFWLLWRSNLPAAFFLSSILTGSGALLVVFGHMAWTPVAERYLYMPTALLTLGWAAWAAKHSLSRHIYLFKGVVICVVIIWSAMTIQRAKIWGDPIALAEDTVAKSPNFLPARKDLANYYIATGEKEKGKQLLVEVMSSARTVGYITADVSMANSLISEGRLNEAHDILLESLKHPGKQYVKVAEHILSLNQKRILEVADDFAKQVIRKENIRLLESIKQRKNDPFIEYRLAKELLSSGEREKAKSLFDSVYQKAPPSAYYREPAGKLAEKLSAEQYD